MYSQTHDFAAYADWTEIDLGAVPHSISIANASADNAVEVSFDAAVAEHEVAPATSWATASLTGSSIWLRRKAGTGGSHMAQVDGFAAPPEPTPKLGPVFEARRKRKKDAIDKTTADLIAKGVEYPAGSGRYFSMSDHAQQNWTDLDRNADDPDLTYPLLVSSVDNSMMHVLVDAADVRGLYRANAMRRLYCYGGGAFLKYLCDQAHTEEALDAIRDDREP